MRIVVIVPSGPPSGAPRIDGFGPPDRFCMALGKHTIAVVAMTFGGPLLLFHWIDVPIPRPVKASQPK
jgi:hypothetical protein